MATADFNVVTVLIGQNGTTTVDIPTQYNFITGFSALSQLSAPYGEQAIYAKYLYYPDVSARCTETQAQIVPSNATLANLGTLPMANPIAIAPSSSCRDAYVYQAIQDRASALILYPPTNNSNSPAPPSSSTVYSAQIPVYLSTYVSVASTVMMMNQYSGDLSNEPFGPALQQLYPQAQAARLVLRVTRRSLSSSLPNLWVFLLVILGLLCVIVATVSVTLHLHQFLARRDLRQRIASGEVDLESLGIKRLTVPRKTIDSLPKQIYGKSDASTFEQGSCAICLDDYETGQTQVRVLPCKHIFHPQCIDEFLEKRSSLCPLCKRSVLPKGYIPPDKQLTAATVMRERARRRQLMREARQRARLNINIVGRRPAGGVSDDLEMQPTTSEARTVEAIAPAPVNGAPPAVVLDMTVPTLEDEERAHRQRNWFSRAAARLFPTGSSAL